MDRLFILSKEMRALYRQESFENERIHMRVVALLCFSLYAVFDVYDTLISERPYKKSFSHEFSLQEIQQNSGIMFDPELVDGFVAMFDE